MMFAQLQNKINFVKWFAEIGSVVSADKDRKDLNGLNIYAAIAEKDAKAHRDLCKGCGKYYR